MKITEILGKRLLLLDGGMGTQLQQRGLAAGELPELWNITRPEDVLAVHKAYLAAGSDVIYANTFGANSFKYTGDPYTAAQVTQAGVALARQAADAFSTPDRPRFVAVDIGPTGKLLRPMGDLDFEDCVQVYSQVVRAGAEAGADLIVIETMSDGYEAKAAALAAKENSDLPVFVTMVFDGCGKLLTGGSLLTAVAVLEGLRVDAIGLNCGLGPIQMLPLVREMAELSSLPLVIKPNAGLPVYRNGETCYDIDPEQFAKAMLEIAKAGGWGIGGCCGTTPEHIALAAKLCRDTVPPPVAVNTGTVVAGYAGALTFGKSPVIIGERINPTGKKRFKQALMDGDMDYILGEGIRQQQSGAHALDVNVGLPGIDESETLGRVVAALQGVTELPLQIDTADPKALETALRIYNGKPLINSVNGKPESMAAVFPLAAKYGGVVVGLTLDEAGIPKTVEQRLEIARRIIETGRSYGIDKKDIIIDALTMTVSADPDSAMVTLETVERLRRELGVHTVLGVSNISFGLPRRELVSSTFYTLALSRGLSAAIINPGSPEMMAVHRAYRALAGQDGNCLDYIAAYSDTATGKKEPESMSLGQAVERGLAPSAVEQTEKLLAAGDKPLDIIEQQLIPALDRVGKGFEQHTVFLPQLMLSAEAAKAAFGVVTAAMIRSGEQREAGPGVILATVKGDIHDIGKNIVKVLLQNYGFSVLDLGRDVDPELIANTARDRNIALVGLSALMTTTVGAMEETIRLLRATAPDCRVMVGGAVMTGDYARSIDADWYAADAMAGVRYARELYNI